MNDMASLPHEGSQVMGLRERKKRLAQATIEEAALRLFQERGYEQTSIQDIADAVMMSPRTFFRYFASKEEVVIGPLRAVLNDGIRFLQSRPSTESPHAALRATFVHMIGLYQEQRTSFLFRYQVAMQTPSIVSVYLYALIEAELAIGDVLCAHLETATNRDEIRFLIAIYMTALRVALMTWLERGASGNVVSLFREHLGYLSSFPKNA